MEKIILCVVRSIQLCIIDYSPWQPNLSKIWSRCVLSYDDGVYRKPREEQRIFLFIDLKSSTALAENLGHSRNSSLVQEFMLDINKCLYAYGATSISMLAMKSLLHGRCQGRMSISVKSSSSPVMNCLKGEAVGMSRNMGSFLLLKQGLIVVRLPPLKLGDMKRDIAYHGDTVNTASRIQALCNTLNKKFLVSQRFYDLISNEEGITAEFLGIFLLKGKEKSVDIYSIATER